VAILALADTRILIQGIASPLARYQCLEMCRRGTALAGIVGDASPELAEAVATGTPFFRSACQAREAIEIDLAMVFNSPFEVKQAVLDSIDAGIRSIVCLTENVPIHDAIFICHRARDAKVTLIGPNSTGVLSPGIAKAGYFCESVCIAGDVGVIAKSGSLAYAVLSEMKSAGIGVSTVVGIGGDAVKGTDFRDHLALFEDDPDTRSIVLLGEIGGNDEELAAAFFRSAITKPVVAFVSGRSVPPGASMGHAGAIVEKGRGDYASKIRALAASGIRVADNIGEIASILGEWRVPAQS